MLPKGPTDNKSASVQVVAFNNTCPAQAITWTNDDPFHWCMYASLNPLRLKQNGLHFPYDIFKCIFLNENVSIAIKISLKFVPKGPIDNIPAWMTPCHYLNQLERLRSEDTPRRPMITHTIDQFILNPKSMLLTSLYRISSQNKMKAEKF